VTRCSMCGYVFDSTDQACHAACPLARGCRVICCPRCGYSMVDPAQSRITRWVQWLGGQRAAPTPAPPAAGVPLLRLATGQMGTVTALAPDQPERARQLGQYGLLLGSPIRLLQKRPVPIIQVGQTDLALDLPIAAEIYVEVHALE
jgi:Fe2+ transport system protein FeoA